MIQKNNKKVCSRWLKNHFQLDIKQYGIISSWTSTSLIQILEKFESLAYMYVFYFRYRFIARQHVLLQKKSIDNSVRRLPLLKIVLHSLFADAIDGLRPNSAYANPFWFICRGSICIKNTFYSIQDGITLSRKWIPGHNRSCISRFFVATREYKQIEESFGIRMLFPKISD